MSIAYIGDEFPWRNKIARKMPRRGKAFVLGIANCDPIPPGCPQSMIVKFGETPEQRAFRRFPINSHKPGR